METFADQAAIAIQNVRLFNETKEALEQQTATSEILRVISRSPTDVQPVFEVVAANAARLCDAFDATIFRVDGDVLRLVAHKGPIAPDSILPLTEGTLGWRVIRERRAVHVDDMQAETREYPMSSEFARNRGFRTVLSVPLLRGADAIGLIAIRRTEVRPFTDRQIALLKTFADQAVIAIENVRLFKELQTSNRDLTTALEQQTATSALLKVIGRSTFELQPVFDTLAENAVRLCEAERAFIWRFDGGRLRAVVTYNTNSELAAYARQNPIAPGRGSGAGRAALERRTIHIEDALTDPEYTFGVRHLDPIRTVLAIPMIRTDELLGVIAIYRLEVRPFTDSQIALMEMFADQAAIAIENARLLTDLQTRTTELTRLVDELTALGDVSRALSSTLDLETVLTTIVSRAIQLSGTDGGSVYEYDEATEEFSLRASRGLPEAYVEQVRDARPRKGEGAVGRVAQTGEPVQIADISDPAVYESRVRNTLPKIGLRALLAVPLIAEDRLVGALVVMRKRTGTFAAEEVTLLQTFATQSALAIQNARLFREIEEKSRQLEVASQHKSEFLANMSHELRTPLNAIIGFSEVLTDRMFGELNEKQEEYLKDIYASGTHLLSLINDILDLSKIEAGRMELELTDFDLPTAIDSALMLVRERAGRRSITLHTAVDTRLGQIQADERKVRQVVLNLLSNAIKFTPEGGRIDVRAVPKDGVVEVSVSDTGIGIAPEDQEKVFEEFRQVGTAAKTVEGTGLGLTLCRKFVELHGGRIWVKSQLGVGSTFTFTLPSGLHLPLENIP
jgi:two-component system, NtrC family, sensor kinase